LKISSRQNIITDDKKEIDSAHYIILAQEKEAISRKTFVEGVRKKRNIGSSIHSNDPQNPQGPHNI